MGREKTMWTLLILTLVPLLINSKANSNTKCSQICNSTHVAYPFGFSSSCKIPLHCSQTGHIHIGNYPIKELNHNSILLELNENCNRNVQDLTSLFSNNYGMSSHNNLMFSNCSAPLQGCYVLTNRMVTRGCGNISCYSENNASFGFLKFKDLMNIQCGVVFSSVVSVEGETDLALRFQAAELSWWLDGECRCSKDAECIEVTKPEGDRGFRCKCKDGFIGDGFIHGGGCRKGPSCSALRYLSGKCGGKARTGVLIGGIIAGALLMAVITLLCCCIRRRSSYLRTQMSAKRLLWEAAGDSSVPLYPYKDITRATNSFSEQQRLGNGAYGTVYAGKLHNDEWVAIKKIRHKDNESIEQVMNEIKLLSSVSHPNLVRLLGCCIENGEQILVYEYMPNGTLSQHLQRERGNGLPWTVRLAIAVETANAIAYLHSAINPPIYHRDVKSSNILLDHNFNTKVADFGLSRLGMTDDSHISTAPQGTPGYVDPEYHQNFYLSDKSDVYSFGVVLVEIISSLKVVDFSRPHSEVNLAALAIDRIGKGKLDDIIDPFIDPNRDAWTLTSINKVAELAFRCLAFHRDMRPSMTEVAEELAQIRSNGWAPATEDNKSSCSSPYVTSERSISYILSSKKPGVDGRKALLVPQRPADCMVPFEEVKDGSPVSIQDPWPSDQSSPSATSLLSHPV